MNEWEWCGVSRDKQCILSGSEINDEIIFKWIDFNNLTLSICAVDRKYMYAYASKLFGFVFIMKNTHSHVSC